MLESVSIMTGLWVIKMGKKNCNIQFISRIERVMKGRGIMNTNHILNELLIQKQLRDHRTYQRQPTMNQLVNFLSKGPQFKKCESNGMSNEVALWELVEGEDEKTGPDN